MALQTCVIAPDRVLWDGPIDEALFSATSGSLGVLEGHAPLLRLPAPAGGPEGAHSVPRRVRLVALAWIPIPTPVGGRILHRGEPSNLCGAFLLPIPTPVGGSYST